MQELKFRDLSIGALWRIGFICNFALWVPVWLVVGVIALFGGRTVTFQDEVVTGVAGLSMAMVPIVALVPGATVLMVVGGLLSRLFFWWFGDWPIWLVTRGRPPGAVPPRPSGPPDEIDMGH